MDDLTRERFWPKSQPPRPDVLEARRTILLGLDAAGEDGDAMQQARLRAEALLRSRRLARAIRFFSVRSAV